MVFIWGLWRPTEDIPEDTRSYKAALSESNIMVIWQYWSEGGD